MGLAGNLLQLRREKHQSREHLETERVYWHLHTPKSAPASTSQ
jgi:hypothetical protein